MFISAQHAASGDWAFGVVILHQPPMFRVAEVIEGMEKGYRDLQKPCQPRSGVLIIANLPYNYAKV